MKKANSALNDHEIKVMKKLADGHIHSGATLADMLGTTRAHVWQIIKKLNEQGLCIQAHKGTGYSLIDGQLDLLDKKKIYQACNEKTKKLIRDILIFSLIPSTNAYLLTHIKQKLPSAVLCVSEGQTAGYGRRGHTWYSPLAQNIYCSLYWCVDNNLANLTGLPLIVGVAIRQALAEFSFTDIQLKWPNDIYWQDKKLGGILVEVVSETAGPCHLVIGIGLNVHMQCKNAQDEIWTSLRMIHGEKLNFSRNDLIAKIMEKLFIVLTRFESQGLAPFLKIWQEADYLYGHDILIETQHEQLQGRAMGISEDGALQVKIGKILQTYRGAAVSIKKI